MLRTILACLQGRSSIRATMDIGPAGHVMPAEMFPRVKLDRTSTAKNLVAANGEKIKDLCEKNPYHSSPLKGCTGALKFRRASVVKPLISMRKVVQAGTVVVLDEKNPHKLDVNNRVCTLDNGVSR